MNAVRDTRTAGKLQADARGPWSCTSPDRRRNREFRAVLRINAIVYIGYCVLFLGAAWAYWAPVVQSFLAVVRGAP